MAPLFFAVLSVFRRKPGQAKQGNNKIVLRQLLIEVAVLVHLIGRNHMGMIAQLADVKFLRIFFPYRPALAEGLF